MRTAITSVLFISCVGLMALDGLTQAVVESRSSKLYREAVRSVNGRETFTGSEVADAAWQVWTNRVQLPAKDSYTVEELKAVLFDVRASNMSYSSATFKTAIGKAAGYRQYKENGLPVFRGLAIITFLGGLFSLGGMLLPSKEMSRL
jgi:hypothetical protein